MNWPYGERIASKHLWWFSSLAAHLSVLTWKEGRKFEMTFCSLSNNIWWQKFFVTDKEMPFCFAPGKIFCCSRPFFHSHIRKNGQNTHREEEERSRHNFITWSGAGVTDVYAKKCHLFSTWKTLPITFRYVVQQVCAIFKILYMATLNFARS